MTKMLGNNPHKTLTRLVGLNVLFDAIAITIWALVPSTRSSIHQLGFLIVASEAAIAATLFAITFFGLRKNLKWAPILAIVIPIIQRIFGTYVFFPSPAVAVTLIWSLLICYFAFRDIKAVNK